MPVITVDFGGTNIKLGIIEGDTLLSYRKIPAESYNGIRPQLDRVKNEILGMKKETALKDNALTALGLAFPGIVDPHKKKVLSTNKKYDDAVNVDFPVWSRESFGLPLVLESDTNSAILGETVYGCARGVSDAALMSFGTGIGTAAIIGGKLLRGKHYQAGCLGGHISINLDGPICTCGNKGCIEAHAGTWSLPAMAKAREGFEKSLLGKSDTVDYKSISECVANGDIFSRDFFDYLLTCAGAGIVNLIHAYDPEMVILSGGLMKDSDIVMPRISQYIKQYAWTPWGDVELRAAAKPDISVLLGLSSLCLKLNGSALDEI